MPRRYKLGPEGEMRRAWNGKLPEEFDQRDVLAFMAETDLKLQGRVSAETLSAIRGAGYDYQGGAVVPQPGKEENDMSKDVILTPEQIAAEERRWLFEAPIAELAEVKGVTIDEAGAAHRAPGQADRLCQRQLRRRGGGRLQGGERAERRFFRRSLKARPYQQDGLPLHGADQ